MSSIWFEMASILQPLHNDLTHARNGASDQFTTILTSLFTFLVVAFLFSTLMVPILNNLRDILTQIVKIKWPTDYLDAFMEGFRGTTDQKKARSADNEKLTFQLQELLSDYESNFNAFKWYKRLFYLVLAIGISWIDLLYWPKIHSWLWIILSYSIWLTIASTLELTLPKPYKIYRMGWLIRKARAHPLALRQVLGAGYYVSSKSDFNSVEDLEKDYFFLSPRLNLTGWRYFLQVYDFNDKDKVYFVSFGPLRNGRRLIRQITPDGYKYGRPIGILPTQNIQANDNSDIRIDFFAFPPSFIC